MKILLKALAVFVLGAIGAGSVIYADSHCPEKQAETEKMINASVKKYLSEHTGEILENLAKNENFGSTVKNFTNINQDEMRQLVFGYLQENPNVVLNYFEENAEAVATQLINTESFKKFAGAGAVIENNTANEEPASDENKLYKEHWKEITESNAAPSIGPKDAKVVVAEFFDFACGHCRALAPVLSQIMKNNPDVRFVFNPLYFISEYSPYAAKVAMAAAEKGKFAEVYEGIMTLPDLNEEAINQILVDEELNIDEIKKMIEEKKIRRGSQEIDALSQVLGINGVPMILINGEAFYGRSLEDIQNKINSYK